MKSYCLIKKGTRWTAFNPTKYGVPDYAELVLVAGDNALKQKPAVFKKFMIAATKGQAYVKAHPKEGLDILLKHEDKSSPLDKAVETKSLQILLPLMDAGNKSFGYQDPATWENIAKWLHDNKVIKSNVSAKDTYINF